MLGGAGVSLTKLVSDNNLCNESRDVILKFKGVKPAARGR